MVTFASIIQDIRAFITKDDNLSDEAYSDAELTEWVREGAHEILRIKKHLMVDEEGNPRKSSEVITGEGVDIPASYHGALLHGGLMFLFADDHARSSFERGLFYQQLGMVGK